MKLKRFVFLLCAVLLLFGYLPAQNNLTSVVAESKAKLDEPPGMENLNIVGAVIRMPPFTDTVLGGNSAYRRALYSKGFVLRSNSTVSYAQNTLNPPVPSDQQTYMGEREFVRLMANPILTYDMRAFHLRSAQLNFAAGLNWVTWNPAGPDSIVMSSLYLYKSFAEGHVETKVGYIGNDFEFVGLQVGGALSTGSQGVYAILPYEVGLSHFPVAAPAFNLNLVGPRNLYFKGSLQRSLDPGGGPATIGRNATGFRFMPKGDKLVTVYEIGYNHRPIADSGQTWLRAGYIRNTTPYPNSRTGIPTPGNFCAYILGDYQLYQSDRNHPNHGIYGGVSAMGTPTDLNAYTRYYELRFYDEGPFRSRPGDTASLVSSYSTYSRYMIANLAAQGKTAWRNSSTVTGSYNFHVARGAYLSAGLSYHAGPDISPRDPNALIFSAILNYFF
jgi:porin